MRDYSKYLKQGIMPMVILKDNHPALLTKCEPVEKIEPELGGFALRMMVTMRLDNGRGLAANQVGLTERMIVMRFGNAIIAMVNPEIIHTSKGARMSTEGCLSVRGGQYKIERFKKVKVKYTDLDGKEYRVSMQGTDAVCVQHEIDHLNGLLISRGKAAGKKK